MLNRVQYPVWSRSSVRWRRQYGIQRVSRPTIMGYTILAVGSESFLKWLVRLDGFLRYSDTVKVDA